MNKKQLRVAIVSVNHESNTFIPSPTTLENFRSSVLLQGEEIRRQYRHAHHEIGGFFQALEEADIEAVPIVFAHAVPWGTVDDEALDTLWKMAREGLEAAGPLNAVLAANHGAGVNASRPDLDGWWFTNLRQLIGKIPLIATIDPHANLTPAMVEACDALIAYRENPHLDQRQRGEEAGRLMVSTLQKGARPVLAASFPPLAINIERQLSFAEPMQSVHRELERVRALPGILSASVTMGFPYADVHEMGSGFLVVADGDETLAQREADRLGNWLWENRELFRGEMISPQEALDRVASSPKPVGLLDMGDNMGGGGPGDSTLLARLCVERGQQGVFWYLPDPDSAARAIDAGVGARLRLSLGGKLPMSPEPPLDLEVEVVSIHDGKFTETKPRHGGRTGGDMGPTAIVRSGGLTIMLMTRRSGPNGSIQPIRTCGLEPKDFEVLLIKGVHAPVGGYQEVCPTLIRVNTPGVTCADLEKLTYNNRRKPLFPFEA
jgi:microcystin degradation protein MlrC